MLKKCIYSLLITVCFSSCLTASAIVATKKLKGNKKTKQTTETVGKDGEVNTNEEENTN